MKLRKANRMVLPLVDDKLLCQRLSGAARSRAARFPPAAFAQALREVLAFWSPVESIA